MKTIDTKMVAIRRSQFRKIAAWAWVQENQPAIAEGIRKEADRKFPRSSRTKVDLSFLQKTKAAGA